MRTKLAAGAVLAITAVGATAIAVNRDEPAPECVVTDREYATTALVRTNTGEMILIPADNVPTLTSRGIVRVISWCGP